MSEAYWHGYERGYQDGIDHGRRQLEAEWVALHAEAVTVSRMVAETPSFADLSERRGEFRRAQRQRQILAERGVSA